MAISATCPNCQANFNLPDELAGRRVKCQKCDHVFTLPKEEPPTVLKAADDDKVSATPPKLRKGPPPPPGKKSKPEERPRKKPAKSGGGMFMMLLVFLLGGGGLLGCLGCAAVIGWISLRPTEVKPIGPIAANDKKDLPIDKVDDLGKKIDAPIDASKPRDKFNDKKDIPVFDDKKDIARDFPVIDDKKDFGKKDDFPPIDLKKDFKDFKDRPFFDKKDKEPPPTPGSITVVFGPDGIYRNNNSITEVDVRNRDNKKHKSYLVQMERGRTYHIDMTSGAFDSYLYLADPANRVVAQDDDGGGYPSARIVHVAKMDGLYRIEATSLNGGSIGAFGLSIRRAGAPIAAAPEMKPGAWVVKSNNVVGVLSVTDTHLTCPPDGDPQNMPVCWDGAGQNFYVLQNGRDLSRVGLLDMKINAQVALPSLAWHLALSSEGVVAMLNNGADVWVFDSQTLQVRNKFKPPAPKFGAPAPVRFVAAPASPQLIAWNGSYWRLDLRTGQRDNLDTGTAPAAATTNVRAMAESPDGKYLCVQGSDSAYHRFRIADTKLIHEGSAPALSKTAVSRINISHDSKRIAFTSSTTPAAKKTTDIFAIDNWNAPVASLPLRMKQVSLDANGGAWAESTGANMRYYANINVKDVKMGKLNSLPSLLLTPPRGEGCLILYSEGASRRLAWLTLAKN